VGVIGVPSLLLVSASLLGAATLLSMLVGRWARDHRPMAGLDDAPLGGGMLDGLKQIFATPFMRYMAILLILSDGIGGVNYALLADYSKATFSDEAARTAFFATVDLVTNGIIIALQALITWWLLPMLGPGRILVIWASIAMLALGLVIVSADPYAPLLAGMPAVAISTIASRALAFGMAEPARHALFTQVPRSERYKGQNAVDTAVWRFGDLLVALSMNAGRAIGVGISGFAALGAGAAAMAALLGWRLSRYTTRGTA
jgi:AAA family ATP:ADP antiporter